MKYQNLSDLLENDPQSKNFFGQLPDYVQEQISTRSGNVTSFDELKNYAENLTRGDG